MNILPDHAEHSCYVDLREVTAPEQGNLVSPCAHSVREPRTAAVSALAAERARTCAERARPPGGGKSPQVLRVVDGCLLEM